MTGRPDADGQRDGAKMAVARASVAGALVDCDGCLSSCQVEEEDPRGPKISFRYIASLCETAMLLHCKGVS